MDAVDRKRVLLIVTGGIAAYKAGDVVRELLREGATVQVVMTRAATEFVTPMTFEVLSGRPVAVGLFPGTTAGSIDHIRLARDADVVAIAPASADFIAKTSAGIADEVALCILLALEKHIKVVWFPAMNVEMWSHPLTQRNIASLKALQDGWHSFEEPVKKTLACGESGQGGLPEPAEVARRILRALAGEKLKKSGKG